jgi:indoleamine 2,3-dioxygenase
MNDGETIWQVTPARGFLMARDPVARWRADAATEQVLETAAGLPDLVAERRVRDAVVALPVPDMPRLGLAAVEAERLHQAYAFLSNAYLWQPESESVRHLPHQLAVPFAAIAERIGRPPVLSYAGTQLANYRVLDEARPLSQPENLAPIQCFQRSDDEAWFWVIHCAIEAAGAPAVIAGRDACDAARLGDDARAEKALGVIADGLEAVTALARRITEGCSPDSFFRTLRPFMFSPPDGIVFEGVARFGGQPQAFLGQTGAQSSLMPAICAALGIRHGNTEMTHYLEAVRAYMPPPHRAFIAGLDGAAVRRAAAGHTVLREAYNACVAGVVAFRRVHLTLAATYIAQHVADPKGTGGTDFMHWLRRMTKETRAQLLPAS